MRDDAGWGEGFPAGLPGSDALAEALAVLGRAGRYGRPSWLLAVGLGARTPGEAACDELGRRLRANVRAGDLVCWLGSPGYAVLLGEAQEADARCVAERLAPALGTPVAVARVAPGEAPEATLDRLCTPPGAESPPRPKPAASPLALSPFAPAESSLSAPPL